ncbi:glycosyl transferase, family 20 [Artemisia annua]|uniref:Glycosyl transferase, family 20 n=1 Tax=Artemisia annua TaxID=35608 RepID=A0A2U1Q0T4_ARTAN|nr:glycosyl transferase, family 20 [Artemisia annua]
MKNIISILVVMNHDVGYWAHCFFQDLEKTCKDQVRRSCWGIGFGLSIRVVDPNFRKLSMEHIVSAYKQTATQSILLDYDGTLMPQSSIDKSPSSKTIEMLNALCQDKNNMVFVVSSKSRTTLVEWFGECEKLGLAAKHRRFLMLKRDEDGETCVQVMKYGWKQMLDHLTLYPERTDGSTIEHKETALSWFYQDADSNFVSCQAKELLDHLDNVLANEPVTVKRGQSSVEVKPQAEVFACTVGNKPSKAKYYLDDTVEIARLMQGFASVSEQSFNVFAFEYRF